METEIKLTYDQAMALAIDVAKAGAPYVSPNPLVGCVILSAENKLLSTGCHERYGEAHAEINAIKNIPEKDLQDCKIFVTLEPCAHEGKTASCAKKLAEYKIKKVIYGLVDPNPLVAGQGAKILQSAGIETEEYQGALKSDLEDLAEIFLKNFRHKKTFVALKVASSLDGQIALKTGESQWITGPASREYVHELRSWYDGLIIGSNTIVTDNPSLNIRHPRIKKENKLVILDSKGKLLKSIIDGKKYKFMEVHHKKNIYFATNEDMKSDYQIILFKDLNHLMVQLWDLQIKSVFVEGGAATYSSFIQSQLVDRFHVFINPSLIGANNGLSWTKDLTIPQLDKKIQLKNIKMRLFESDIYLTGRH